MANYKIVIYDPQEGDPLGTFIVKGMTLSEAKLWAKRKFKNADPDLEVSIEKV